MGAPRSAYADSNMIIIRGEAVEALGDWTAAGVFQRIAWRCERTGDWRATLQIIADETWLTVEQVRRALRLLRDKGWITASQPANMDRTFVYSVVWDEAAPPGPPPHLGSSPNDVGSSPNGVGSSPDARGAEPRCTTYRDSKDKNPQTPRPRDGAAAILTSWLDGLRPKPTAKLTGQLKAEIDGLLDAGYSSEQITAGLERWKERDCYSAAALAPIVLRIANAADRPLTDEERRRKNRYGWMSGVV